MGQVQEALKFLLSLRAPARQSATKRWKIPTVATLPRNDISAGFGFRKCYYLNMKKKRTIDYKKIKAEAKKLYSKIGRIHSPALSDEYVAFTSIGFTHLVRKGRNPRPRSEQKRRFALLPHAEAIITNPQAIIVYRTTETKYWANRYGEKVFITSTAHFWTFIEKIDGLTIKIVIRQLNSGQKHFFSIMGNKKSP